MSADFRTNGSSPFVRSSMLLALLLPPGLSAVLPAEERSALKLESFNQDPRWEGHNNRAVPSERPTIVQDFGYSHTNFAGRSPGEMGGQVWRASEPAYYADRVGPLSLDDRLEAGGTVVLQVGAPDADMFFGWFNSAEREKPPIQSGHFLGVHVGGPTRVGHYFHPSLATASAARSQSDAGPVLAPGKVHRWSLVYEPAAEGGKGTVRVTLDDQSVTLALKQGVRAQGASFDRFGLFTSTIGGQVVKIFLDDLKYTAAGTAR